MSRVAVWIRGVALALGAPGLFLVAFLDSSFLSLPEIADLLVVYMVAEHPARVVVYVLFTTLGSVCGCLVMYRIGKMGGDAIVRKRFASASVERAMGFFQRYGTMTVLVPCLLPPPMPFKIFVLLAGVVGIPVHRFVLAIAVGRGARYTVLGLLAIRYGKPAMAYLREHGVFVSLVAVSILLTVFAVYLLWSKRRQRNTDRM